MKIEVHKQGGTRKVIDIEAGATKGATVGVNVWNQDGTLFVPASGGTPTPGGGYVTYWRFILEIPANIVALAALTGTGIVRRTGDSTFDTAAVFDNLADVNMTGVMDGEVPVYDAVSGTYIPGTVEVDIGVPYYIPVGETYRVPENIQALFAMPIEVDGDLEVDGYLVQVS